MGLKERSVIAGALLLETVIDVWPCAVPPLPSSTVNVISYMPDCGGACQILLAPEPPNPPPVADHLYVREALPGINDLTFYNNRAPRASLGLDRIQTLDCQGLVALALTRSRARNEN